MVGGVVEPGGSHVGRGELLECGFWRSYDVIKTRILIDLVLGFCDSLDSTGVVSLVARSDHDPPDPVALINLGFTIRESPFVNPELIPIHRNSTSCLLFCG